MAMLNNTARTVDYVITRARIGHARLIQSHLCDREEQLFYLLNTLLILLTYYLIVHQPSDVPLSIGHIIIRCLMYIEERQNNLKPPQTTRRDP